MGVLILKTFGGYCMNLIPVPTLILLQLIPFLLTSVALYYILFKPMLEYLEKREEKISGAREQALSLSEQSKSSMQKIQEDTKATRLEIAAKRSEARNDAMKVYNSQIQAARDEVEKEIKAEAQKIHTNQSSAREELKMNARDIASFIASQTLGRPVS